MLVIVSFAKLSTRVIKLESIFEAGIESPVTTFFSPAMSFTFNNKSIVFCPCSAYIVPPVAGVVVKSYVLAPNSLNDPYPFLLSISAFIFVFSEFI